VIQQTRRDPVLQATYEHWHAVRRATL